MTAPAPRTALITGASAGIGQCFAELLASEGYDLLLVARRETRLLELAAQLAHKYGVRCDVLAADLSDPAAPKAIAARSESLGLTIDALINNAGLSGNGTFVDTPWDTLAAEIQIQVTAATELTHLFAKGMRERGWGRIVNLSSLAAFQHPAAGLLYTAIKNYSLNMSQALDLELKPHGVHVTALCPGFTHSEFHDIMETRDAADKLPSAMWTDPDFVARTGWSAVMKGKPVCVPGTLNKVLSASMRPLPLSAQYALSQRIKLLG